MPKMRKMGTFWGPKSNMLKFPLNLSINFSEIVPYDKYLKAGKGDSFANFKEKFYHAPNKRNKSFRGSKSNISEYFSEEFLSILFIAFINGVTRVIKAVHLFSEIVPEMRHWKVGKFSGKTFSYTQSGGNGSFWIRKITLSNFAVNLLLMTAKFN